MAKLKCTGNFIHSGTRHYVGDEVDTVKDKIDADSIEALTKAGCLAKPPKAAPKETGPTEAEKAAAAEAAATAKAAGK